ncbi:MAG: hypothetical protein ACXADF_17870 [Candidatus Thorarchaeota archaeon]|jgi:hypothetical protein
MVKNWIVQFAKKSFDVKRMGKVTTETEIEAPIERVFEFLSNPLNFEKLLPDDAEANASLGSSQDKKCALTLST